MAKPAPTPQMADFDDDKSWGELSDDERNAVDEVILSALVDKKDIQAALTTHVQSMSGVAKGWITNRWINERLSTAEFQHKAAPVLEQSQLAAGMIAAFALPAAIRELEKKDFKLLGDLVASLPTPESENTDDETVRKALEVLRDRRQSWKLDQLEKELE